MATARYIMTSQRTDFKKNSPEKSQFATLVLAAARTVSSIRPNTTPIRYPKIRLERSITIRVIGLMSSSNKKPHLPVKRFSPRAQTPIRPKANRNGPIGSPIFNNT